MKLNTTNFAFLFSQFLFLLKTQIRQLRTKNIEILNINILQ